MTLQELKPELKPRKAEGIENKTLINRRDERLAMEDEKEKPENDVNRIKEALEEAEEKGLEDRAIILESRLKQLQSK